MGRRSRGLSRPAKLILYGAGVASVAALVIAAVRRSRGRTVDMVGGGRKALAETEQRGRAAMGGAPEVVDGTLERFRALFDDFHPDAVAARARELYSDDAYFNDGFVELRGADAIARYLGRSAEATASIHVDIEQITRGEEGVYLRWVMTFTIHHMSMTIAAPGISHLRLTPAGTVCYHHDYWDGSGALAEMVPFAGSLLRAIKTKL